MGPFRPAMRRASVVESSCAASLEAASEEAASLEAAEPETAELALPPQAARQTARRMLGEDFTPRLLPLEKLTAFSTE